ncbi:MAG: hypothetical protein ACRCVQ_13670 [Acinetobacter ursingii]
MAGGSQIIINSDGITIITPAKFEAKAGQHIFEGGANISPNLPSLPVFEAKPQDLFLEYFHADGIPAKGSKYTVTFSDGSQKTGFLDESGQAFVQNVPVGEAKVVYEPVFSENAQSATVDDSWFSNFIQANRIK